MASLALGVAGAAIGSAFGPFGTSIGWMIGSALGTALDPQKIQGPKLSDLKVQGTEYGTSIPIVYGSVRIAGCCVLWKSDLIPHDHTSGGKGGPETTTTTYTCSFAIQLCEGPIASVRRVWADNRLVYEDGDGSISFVTYLGDEEQLPDPTAEALYGVGNVPAHRGYAYVSFTDLDLTDYGNRIPNFTFEVVTVGEPPTGSLRRIETQYDTGGVNFSHGLSPSYVVPLATYWPWSSGNIRVKTAGYPDPSVAISYYEYDRATLTAAAPGVIHDDDPTAFRLHADPGCPGGGDAWNFYPVGTYVYADGATVPLWVSPTLPIGMTINGPAMYDGAVTLTGCGPPNSVRNILFDAGLPDDEYIGGAVLSANGERLFVFTSPTPATSGGFTIDKWYEVIDGELTRSGTVTPHLLIYQIGFGNSAIHHYECSMFEDNGKYCWTFFGAEGDPIAGGSGGVMRYYEIDDSNNFALAPYPGTYHFAGDTAGGTRAVGEDTFDAEGGSLGSVRIIRTGYAGLVTANNLLVFSRFTDDSADLLLKDIVSDLSVRAGLDTSQIDVTELTDIVHGYVIANQADVRSAIAPLQTAYFFDGVESGALIKFPKRGQEPLLTIPDAELAAHEDKGEAPALLEFARAQEVDLPRRITTTYFDLNAAYQNGTQIAQRLVTLSRAEMSVPLPIALDSAAAKQIADRLLFSAWYERDSFTFTTPRKYCYLEPTDSIIAAGRSLRISTREEQAGGVIKWTGVQTIGAVFTQEAGGVSGGGNLPAPIVLPQATALQMLDIAYIADPARQNVYWGAMAGAERASWRGAGLYRSKDAVNYDILTDSHIADVIGSADTVLATFLGGNVFDEVNSVDVTIGAGGGELAGTTREAILDGANEYALGGEIVQARDVELVTGTTYRLTGLLRGRRGTEWAMDTHVVDERFVVLPTHNELSYLTSDVAVSRLYKAVTFGNTIASATAQELTLRGVSMTPYSPVHASAGINTAGDWTLQWIRRARVNGAWLNFTDVPLDEPSEQYRVTLWSDVSYQTIITTIDCSAATLTLTAAEQTVLFGSPQSELFWAVAQIGRLGPGYDSGGHAPTIVTPPPLTAPPATGVPPIGVQWHEDFVFTGGKHADLNCNYLMTTFGSSWCWTYKVNSAAAPYLDAEVVAGLGADERSRINFTFLPWAGGNYAPAGTLVPWGTAIFPGPVLHSDVPLVDIPLPYPDDYL